MFILPYLTHRAVAEPCTDFRKTTPQNIIFMKKLNSLQTLLTFCYPKNSYLFDIVMMERLTVSAEKVGPFKTKITFSLSY
jgi:hypothetical protein